MARGERDIRWTIRALDDKLDIMEFWYQRNQSLNFPIKLEKLFLQSLGLLALHPEMGLVFSKDPLILYKTVHGYRLYYTFETLSITLLAIWDTRRNPDKFKL